MVPDYIITMPNIVGKSAGPLTLGLLTPTHRETLPDLLWSFIAYVNEEDNWKPAIVKLVLPVGQTDSSVGRISYNVDQLLYW